MRLIQVLLVVLVGGTAWAGDSHPWRLVEVIRLPESSEPSSFGFAVDMDPAGMVVGGPWTDTFVGTGWIFGPDTSPVVDVGVDSREEGGMFGFDVELNEDSVLLSALYSDHPTTGNRSAGAVFHFDRATGERLHVFRADDGVHNHLFGYRFATNSRFAFIGALGDEELGRYTGAVYVFDLETGLLVQKILAPNPVSDAKFGLSVAASESHLLVGAIHAHSDGSSHLGEAYVFDANTLEFKRTIVPPAGYVAPEFGYGVAISGDIGAVATMTGGEIRSGQVYLFNLVTGELLNVVEPSVWHGPQWFGWSMDMTDELLIVGGRHFNIYPDSFRVGAAYLFDLQTGTEIQCFGPTTTAQDQLFGESVAISGDRIAVTAPGDQQPGFEQGAVYIFERVAPSDCPADLDGNGTLTTFDFWSFLNALRTAVPAADLAEPHGVFNFFDLAEFIAAFNAGCP